MYGSPRVAPQRPRFRIHYTLGEKIFLWFNTYILLLTGKVLTPSSRTFTPGTSNLKESKGPLGDTRRDYGSSRHPLNSDSFVRGALFVCWRRTCVVVRYPLVPVVVLLAPWAAAATRWAPVSLELFTSVHHDCINCGKDLSPVPSGNEWLPVRRKVGGTVRKTCVVEKRRIFVMIHLSANTGKCLLFGFWSLEFIEWFQHVHQTPSRSCMDQWVWVLGVRCSTSDQTPSRSDSTFCSTRTLSPTSRSGPHSESRKGKTSRETTK